MYFQQKGINTLFLLLVQEAKLLVATSVPTATLES